MRPVNILIGANGAGKSNFISIFSLLRAISQGKFQDYVRDNGGANSLLHFGAKKTRELLIDIHVSENSYHAELQHELFEDILIFKKEYCLFDRSNKVWPIRGKNNESGLYSGQAASGYVRAYTRDYLEECLVYHFHDTSKTAGFKQSSSLEAIDYLYNDAKNIAAFLLHLKNNYSESYTQIVQAVRAIAPFFHDFYLEPRGEGDKKSVLLKWLQKKHDEPFSAQQLSDGTARFICLATLFLQPANYRPDTIILDEPELGLHPAALEVLSDIIKSVAKNGQVICSTQSVTFSNHFAPEDFIVVDQKEGVSTFSRPDAQQLAAWIDDFGMGEIWNKNLIGGRPEW